MLAVCVNASTENRIESVLEILLAELAEEKHEKFDLIQSCALEAFLWGRLEAQFGYKSKNPGVRDFAISLFKSCYTQSLEEPSALTQEAFLFLKRWRDNIRHQAAFAILSEDCANILGIEKDLQNRDIRNLIEADFFRLIDQKILSALARTDLRAHFVRWRMQQSDLAPAQHPLVPRIQRCIRSPVFRFAVHQ